jgi:hypothetical protein
MPVKSRRAKRRLDPAAELEAWAMTFETGRDYFNDLVPFCFPHGSAGEDEVYAAAPEAWRRLGAMFMAIWEPTAHRPLPWALEEFGDPRCH